MPIEANQQRAENNFQALKENRYPGRLIILGLSEDGHDWVQLYGVTGRSFSSRNRKAALTGNGQVTIGPGVPSPDMGNPELIYYDAMIRAGMWDVVSNGKQTNDIAEKLAQGMPFRDTLEPWNYEPDAPNNTQRIVGAINRRTGTFNFGRITKDPNSEEPIRVVTPNKDVPVNAGFGYCFHTYVGDGKVLLPFTETPYLVPLPGPVNGLTSMYWEALNADNKVTLINKYSPTQPALGNNGITVMIRNKIEEDQAASNGAL